jgi:predicted Zn-dependent protease
MGSYTAYLIAKKRAYKASRDMEYEADIEGAKLAARAGYDLTKGKEVVSIINTLYYADELNQTHPDAVKRIENFEQNRKYFMETEWKKQGEYNIYNSEVLTCEKSSNRNSIVITRGNRKNQDAYYHVETPYDMYLRYGYKSYLAGDFKDAIKYFKDYLKMDKGDYAVYLYVSYAYENLYKQTDNEKYLELAKEFASYAKTVAPDNKYVKEQILAL